MGLAGDMPAAMPDRVALAGLSGAAPAAVPVAVGQRSSVRGWWSRTDLTTSRTASVMWAAYGSSSSSP